MPVHVSGAPLKRHTRPMCTVVNVYGKKTKQGGRQCTGDVVVHAKQAFVHQGRVSSQPSGSSEAMPLSTLVWGNGRTPTWRFTPGKPSLPPPSPSPPQPYLPVGIRKRVVVRRQSDNQIAVAYVADSGGKPQHLVRSGPAVATEAVFIHQRRGIDCVGARRQVEGGQHQVRHDDGQVERCVHGRHRGSDGGRKHCCHRRSRGGGRAPTDAHRAKGWGKGGGRCEAAGTEAHQPTARRHKAADREPEGIGYGGIGENPPEHNEQSGDAAHGRGQQSRSTRRPVHIPQSREVYDRRPPVRTPQSILPRRSTAGGSSASPRRRRCIVQCEVVG